MDELLKLAATHSRIASALQTVANPQATNIQLAKAAGILSRAEAAGIKLPMPVLDAVMRVMLDRVEGVNRG